GWCRVIGKELHGRRDTGLRVMLAGSGTSPGQAVGEDIDNYDDATPQETQKQTEPAGFVRSEHDVVHVPDKAGGRDHGYVYIDEEDKGTHHKEMKRSADLPVAGQLRIPSEAIRQGWRHRRAGENR